MGAQENIRLVQDMFEASRARDEGRYLSFWADDAVSRVAGVPRALGGVVNSKEQRRENFRNLGPPTDDQVRTIFGDDRHVCVVERVTANFDGNQFLKGTGKPFTTYECNIYEIEGGRVKASTNYTNFLDVYVQAGMLDLKGLTR